MSPRTNRRVLVVDDERNNRTTLADILADEGFLVTTACSGEEAVKLCGRTTFDVVLMDVRMPGIDGVEAVRRIRVKQNGVSVVMMSAYCMEEARREALAEGALDFMRKPLDLERLIELVGPAREPDRD